MNARSTSGDAMASRVEQKDIRQRQILETALDLFIRKGYSATTIADIADAAGMSKGLTFNYFPSKEILYGTLVRKGIETARTAFDGPGGDPLAFFGGLTRTILTTARQNPGAAKMFVLMGDAAREACPPGDEAREARRENLRITAELIERGQEKGSIREGSPTALASAYWGSIQGVCELAIQEPGFEYPEPEWIMALLRKERTT